MPRIAVILLLSLIICGCTNLINDMGVSEEVVNGFHVKWRSQISPKQKEVVYNILNNMVFVKGGVFTMGATPEQTSYARENEYPNIYVRLSDYYICKYEISDEELLILLPSVKNYPATDSTPLHVYPTRINWETVVKILQDITSLNFNFPTEAQWEYAARGGEYSKGYVYPGSNDLDEVWSSSYDKGSDVPNELGIYNMADLKSEWCLDYYEEYKQTGLQDNRCVDDNIHKVEEDAFVVRGGNYRCSGKSESYLQSPNSSIVHDSFGYFEDESRHGLNEPYDYRYCRTSARSYYYYGIGGHEISVRMVINIKQ